MSVYVGLDVGGGTRLLSPARAVMRQHLRLVPLPEVRLSHLGDDTALIGAIVVAMQGLE